MDEHFARTAARPVPPATVPATLVNLLIGVALQTETGRALMVGFRIGRGDTDGRARIEVSHDAAMVPEDAPSP